MGIFGWLWEGLRKLVGLVLPVFARATDFRAYGPAVRTALHVFVLAVILVLLAVLQIYVFKLTYNFPGYPLLEFIWLPVLFLLIYVLVWACWWLWRILFSEERYSDFPDIDAAWDEAKQALLAADIDWRAVPLFLVLGRPAAGEESLFQAAKLPFTVKQVPGPNAPVQVWANRQDGIFVTCADASRLGSRATLLALTGRPAAAPGEAPPPDDDMANQTIGTATIGSGAQAGVISGLMNPLLTEEERRRRYKAFEAADNPEETRRLTARLGHLCRLLVRDRSPEPPANGILLLIPHAATQSKQAAEGTTRDCQQDLGTVWKIFRLHCPLIALVCDLETVPGFPTFLEAHLAKHRTEEEKRKERERRLGRRLGWGLGIDPERRRRMVEEQVQWIGHGMLPKQVYKGQFRIETPGRDDPAEVVRNNYLLCRFLNAMHAGQRLLTGIVVNGLLSKADGPELLGGCYLAATGRDANREQAFVAGVFERLVEAVSYISWSEEAFREEAQYQLMTRYGYILLPAFVAAALILGYNWWFWK